MAVASAAEVTGAASESLAAAGMVAPAAGPGGGSQMRWEPDPVAAAGSPPVARAAAAAGLVAGGETVGFRGRAPLVGAGSKARRNRKALMVLPGSRDDHAVPIRRDRMVTSLSFPPQSYVPGRRA